MYVVVTLQHTERVTDFDQGLLAEYTLDYNEDDAKHFTDNDNIHDYDVGATPLIFIVAKIGHLYAG